MHFDGGCVGSTSRVDDYSGFNTSPKSMCFGTTCPECGDSVFFVRHNGGSVWLDPPLGWPWYKHGCFYPEEIAAGIYDSALVTAEIENDLTENTSYEIGVVNRTLVETNRNYTDIVLDMGQSDTKEIQVKNNARFLLGKLCVLNREKEEIRPFYEPEYLFTLYDPEKHKYVIPPPIVKTPKKPKYGIVPGFEMVNCSVCDCQLLKKNLKKHMRKIHKNANKVL